MAMASTLACSAGVFVLELAVVSSPPYWLEQSRWGGGGRGVATCTKIRDCVPENNNKKKINK